VRPAVLRPAVLLAVGVVAGVLVVALVVSLLTGPGAVTTPFLTYAPPTGWSTAPPGVAATTDAPALLGTLHGPRYPCGDEEFVRGFAASALLPTDATAGPVDRAERVARWFAEATFSAADGTAPAVTVGPPRPVQVAGPDGPVGGTVTEAAVRAPAVRTPADRASCTATAGRVLVLAVPRAEGAALLLVAGDTEGGPAEPAVPDPSTLDAVIGSARLPA
jgi:hypothetical protein